MRFKNRYLVVQLHFSPPSLCLAGLSAYVLYRELRHCLLTNFGEFGYGQVTASLQVKYLNNRTNIAIVRAPRDDWEVVRTAMTLLKEVQGQSCVLRVLHVGGTIRSCQKAAVRWNRSVLLDMWRRKVEDKTARGSLESKEREALNARGEIEGVMAEAEAEIGKLEA